MAGFEALSYFAIEMQPATPDPKTEAKSDNKQYGCTELIIRVVIAIIAVLVIDYGVALIFHRAYPHDEMTTALKPFQNNYLAQTSAFITSEGQTSEFTDDPSPTSRFWGLAIVIMVGVFMLFAILYAIPFTRKAINYTWHGLFLALFVWMVDAMFFPPVMTVFDRDNKVMIIHQPSMFFFGTKTEVPFEQISGFTYEPHFIDGFDHYDDVLYADLFANTNDGKVFIGDNQIGVHSQIDAEAPLSDERQAEIDGALKALHQLIGK